MQLVDFCIILMELTDDLMFLVVILNSFHLLLMQFSMGLDGRKVEPESNVLLASIENMQYAVTLDVLHMVPPLTDDF